MHSLTFQLKQTTFEEPGVPAATELDIYARVDGMPLLEQDGNYTFDLHAVIGTGPSNARINPFVCSCGNAACAGIHTPVEITATEETVTWRFPEEPFRYTLNPRLFPAAEPLILEFDRSEYEKSLEQAQRNLETVAV